MKNAPRTLRAVAATFLTYLLWHLIFLIRFGRINTDVNVLDLYFVLAAFLLFLFVFFVLDRLPDDRRRARVALVAALTLPVSLLGALVGGLLGPVGIVIGMLVPMSVAVSVTYAVLGRRK